MKKQYTNSYSDVSLFVCNRYNVHNGVLTISVGDQKL